MAEAKKTKKSPPSIGLALQGGGSHCAFAWGVLDALLESGVAIEAISAVSGGAMNAVVLADGFAREGNEGARVHLQALWKKVSIAASMLPIRTNIVDKFLSDVGIDFSPSTIALDYMTRMFSPYQFNLFDLNPLRGIIAEMVDFDNLRTTKKPSLFINATHALTGEGKIFTPKELSLDAVMASACLPYLFKTVSIDGEPYWDGGFSANPPLLPLVEAGVRDIVLIRTLTAASEDVPTKAADILDRATEISFAATLRNEERLIAAHNALNPTQAVTVHTIAADEVLASLGRSSKLNAEWDFLLYVHDLGVQAGKDWLQK